MSTLKVDAIRHNSATSDAITTAADGTCTAKITGMTGGGALSHRNIIINGAAQVNQRGNQTSITSSTYSVDRFRVAISAGGTWSFSQSTDSPDGFSNSVKLDCTTAAGSPGLVIIQQRIEGYNVQQFAKGTSSAKQFAVSFYVKTNKSGVYTVELKDDDNSRQISKTFTVSDANWNRYTLIFPADTTGAFGNDSNGSLYLSIWLAVSSSSTYTSGTLNSSSWATLVNANRVSSSNVNLADSTSNEFLLTGVQLEVGDTVTSFEHRSFGEELTRCKRYYQTVPNNLFIIRGSDSIAYSNAPIQSAFLLPESMRANPTGSNYTDGGSLITVTYYNASYGSATNYEANISNDIHNGTVKFHLGHNQANNSSTTLSTSYKWGQSVDPIAFSAEL